MKRLIFLIIVASLSYALPSEEILKKEIGRMLIVGFDDSQIDENSSIIKNIRRYNLGGVILFDRFYKDRNRVKNINSAKQLKKLTKNLHKYAKKPILISVDEEGGMVARLKPKYGFLKIPSQEDVAKMDIKEAKSIYKDMASMLKKEGINCDFAPVVDLAINPDNFVIVKLHRSFGKDPKKVAKYAEVMINELNKKGIISVLKHFPGHGSSLGDSHKGFVDVTNTWSKKELEPYKILIGHNLAKAIMTAHVFNAKIDPLYPATLSCKTNQLLLRERLGFKGVIISDDLQMKAILKQYTLKQTLTLSINAGVDMLLFANQLAKVDVAKVVNTICKLVKNGDIPYKKIKQANKRINTLLNFYHIKN